MQSIETSVQEGPMSQKSKMVTTETHDTGLESLTPDILVTSLHEASQQVCFLHHCNFEICSLVNNHYILSIAFGQKGD